MTTHLAKEVEVLVQHQLQYQSTVFWTWPLFNLNKVVKKLVTMILANWMKFDWRYESRRLGDFQQIYPLLSAQRSCLPLPQNQGLRWTIRKSGSTLDFGFVFWNIGLDSSQRRFNYISFRLKQKALPQKKRTFQIALELITEMRGVFTGQQAHSISPDHLAS
jgi:hypothetical protein